MTGQTSAGAAPARTLTAADPITRAATSTSTRALRACAAAGPLFVATALAQALTRPGFNLSRDALSLLDDGNLGWIQAANFIVSGVLLIAASVAVRRAITAGPGSRWAPRLLAITGGAPDGSLTRARLLPEPSRRICGCGCPFWSRPFEAPVRAARSAGRRSSCRRCDAEARGGADGVG